MDYTHQERTKFTAPLIYNLIVLLIVIVSVGAVFVYTSIYIPQYMDVVLTGLISLLTGGIGGYGFGSRKALEKKTGE